MKLTQSIRAALAALAFSPTIALAQGEGGMGRMYEAIVPAKAGCAPMAWNVARSATPGNGGDMRLIGIVWFTDGTGIGSLNGVEQSSGAFTVQVTPVSGNAPAGTATGRRNADGSIDFTLKGQGCSNVTAHAAPGQTTTAR